jgi:hypothetical protein
MFGCITAVFETAAPNQYHDCLFKMNDILSRTAHEIGVFEFFYFWREPLKGRKGGV